MLVAAAVVRREGRLHMKSKLGAALAVAAAITLAPAAGRADTLSSNVFTNGMLAVTANTTQPITLSPPTLNPFNPSLGTLIGLTVNFVFLAPPGVVTGTWTPTDGVSVLDFAVNAGSATALQARRLEV
jgi:hypothetical protein